MTAGDLGSVLKSIAPVVREFIAGSVEGLTKRLEALEARPVVQAKDGVGIASLTISADGRLLAHLTDGRALDAGPVPSKEGPAGKDADLSAVTAIKDGLSELRNEFRQAPSPDDVEALIIKTMAGLPPAVAGKDGTSVTLADVAPVIVAEVSKAVAALPAAKDGQSVDLAEVHQMIATAVAELPRPQDGIDGKDGTSVAVSDVAAMVTSEVAKAVAAVPKAKDGVDGTSVGVADVAPIISAEVTKAVASLPLPKDGKSVDPLEVDALVAKYVEPLAKDVEQAVSAIPGAIASMVQHDVASAVAAIPPAKDGAAGQSVDMSEVDAMIATRVQKAVASLPVPKDGASVTVADVAPVIASEVDRAVAAVPRAKDGVGLAGAVIDREGRLVLTLSDGGVKELGQVVGRSVDMAEVKSTIAHEVAQIPRPKDGKDGVDGFSFDDYEEVSDGERTITRRFTHGDRVKEFTHKLPAVIYRGVWSEGKTYERGDSVTFGGHTWIAKDDTAVKPDFTPASAKCWTLSVKAGRDGREGKPGPEGPKGSKGDPESGYK